MPQDGLVAVPILHMTVRYLGPGQIVTVELDQEPTCEVGPTLAIYRERNMGCRRGGCGEHWQRPPESIIDIRQPFPAPFSVAVRPRSVKHRRTSAAARVTLCMRPKPQNSSR